MPRWLANTWDESCCSANVDCDSDGEPSNPASVTIREFETVDIMLATLLTEVSEANCWNYTEVGDGIKSFWVKTADPTLSDNGSDIRESIDGSVMRRINVLVTE